MIEIKDIYGNSLFKGDYPTVKAAVEAAVSKKVSLSSADLSYADLRSADLSSADLRYANLRSADLSYADLSYANLRNADLSSADLSYADLRKCVLTDASLANTVFSGAKLHGAIHPALKILKVKDLDKKIAKATAKPKALDMGNWHTCKTTHCRAGWAIVLAGEAGKTAEALLGPAAAGAFIYAASRSKPVPSFTEDTEEARASIIKDARG